MLNSTIGGLNKKEALIDRGVVLWEAYNTVYFTVSGKPRYPAGFRLSRAIEPDDNLVIYQWFTSLAKECSFALIFPVGDKRRGTRIRVPRLLRKVY